MSVDPKEDKLRAVGEKLKQLTDDTQEQYEAFIDASQHYKKGNVNQKDFLAKLADYLIAMTSLNFIAIQVLFEVNSSIKTNLSKKNLIPTPSKADPDLEEVGLAKSTRVKNCIVCGSTIPGQAKFCNKCGNSQ
jgi:hypothetical protein